MFDLHLVESRFITDVLVQHNFEGRPSTSKMEPNNTWHTHQVSGREPLTTCSTHPAWSQCVTKAPRPETKSSMPVWSRAAAAAASNDRDVGTDTGS